MELKWSGKVVIQGVWWWSLGGFSDLRCGEFWKVEVLGSELYQVVLGGGFRVVMVMEWGAGLLELWVDLRVELGVVCRVLEALDQMERKRRKRPRFCRGRGGELGGSRGALMLSLSGRQKAEGGGF